MKYTLISYHNQFVNKILYCQALDANLQKKDREKIKQHERIIY